MVQAVTFIKLALSSEHTFYASQLRQFFYNRQWTNLSLFIYVRFHKSIYSFYTFESISFRHHLINFPFISSCYQIIYSPFQFSSIYSSRKWFTLLLLTSSLAYTKLVSSFLCNEACRDFLIQLFEELFLSRCEGTS